MLFGILFFSIMAGAETIVLQQDVGGYTGCTDSYYDSNKKNANRGNSGNLAAGSLRYLDY